MSHGANEDGGDASASFSSALSVADKPVGSVPLSSFGEDSTSFCDSVTMEVDVEHPPPWSNWTTEAQQEWARYSGCLLYAASCCMPRDGRCEASWTELVRRAHGKYHALISPRCSQTWLLDMWAFVAVLLAIPAGLLIVIYGTRELWAWCTLFRDLRVVCAPPVNKAAAVQATTAVVPATAAAQGCLRISEVVTDSPGQLLGVHVGWLAAALADADDASTLAVMHELWKGHRFLERATDAGGRPLGKLAIISYRCVTSTADVFTLDAHALRSTVLAAQQSDVDYLWLDAWAYRKQPPWAAYDHADFVRTLLSVMLRVSHVIWLPRSRADAKGEYQYRIWCTFEATIVHLRRLPVTAAGHPLDRTQRAIATHGPHLINVWRSLCCVSDGNVDSLARINLFFVVCIVSYVAYLGYQVILIWHSPSPMMWFIQVAGRVVVIAVLVAIWLYIRSSKILGQAAMYTRNGQAVLQLMLSAACGSKRPTVDVDQIARMLPWLSAFDRRDAMTIKMVLDDIEDLVDDQAQRAEFQAETNTGVGFVKEPLLAALRESSARGKRNRERRGRKRSEHVQQNHALALSLFVHARINMSPGDAPQGQSVRSWMKQIGITILQGGHHSLLSEGEVSQSTSSKTSGAPDRCVATPQRWLDSPLRLTAGTWPEPSQPERDSAHHLPSTLETHQDILVGAAVQVYGWKLVRGVRDFVETPVGRFALEDPLSRLPTSSRGFGSAAPRATPSDEAGESEAADALHMRLSHMLPSPPILIISQLLFIGLALLQLLHSCRVATTSEGMTLDDGAAVFPDEDPFVVLYLTPNLVVWLFNVFWSVIMASCLVIKVRSDFCSGGFPIPAHCTGKIEYALGWAVVIMTQFLSLQQPGRVSPAIWKRHEEQLSTDDSHPLNLTDSISLSVEKLPPVVFYGEAVVNTLLAFLIGATGLYEIIIAVSHATAATMRTRNPRYLFEFAESWAQAKRRFA